IPAFIKRPVVKGSPVKSRRGPATVTGCRPRGTSPLGSHRLPGKAPQEEPGSQETCPPASQFDPRGRGGSDENQRFVPRPGGGDRACGLGLCGGQRCGYTDVQ